MEETLCPLSQYVYFFPLRSRVFSLLMFFLYQSFSCATLCTNKSVSKLYLSSYNKILKKIALTPELLDSLLASEDQTHAYQPTIWLKYSRPSSQTFWLELKLLYIVIVTFPQITSTDCKQAKLGVHGS
eukprot:1159126-Pelagomonas_calceolata.AAC.2